MIAVLIDKDIPDYAVAKLRSTDKIVHIDQRRNVIAIIGLLSFGRQGSDTLLHIALRRGQA